MNSPSMKAIASPNDVKLMSPSLAPSSPHSKLAQKADVEWDCTNWDLDTQQPHGGQEWSKLDNFCEDFSVTTNSFGPPWMAVTAAVGSLQHLHHYPSADF